VYRACQLLRQGGLTNLSLDLMLGLQRCQAVPDEQAAAEVFKGDLTRAVAVSPEHLSIYMLGLREESSSTEKHRVGEHPRFSKRRMQELYLYSVRFLAHHGFEQYEISNFARPGFESVHNRQYWRGGEYRGLGPGAVSTLGNRRMKNVVSLQEYLSLTERGERPVGEVEILDPSARDLERIMLALRQRAGISPDELMGRISQSARRGLLSYLSEMRALGFCEITSERLALTPRGQLRSNAIISDIARLMERT
jgi:oxygen-independent coproporphyrinogen-3 oxidase